MEKTRKFLNICIGISVIVCSVSLLIFSTRQNKVIAQTGNVLPDGVIVAGTALVGSGFSASYYVVGYNPKSGAVTVLGKISPKEMRD